MDDDEGVQMIASRTLEHMGYRVTTARHGKEAISLYRQGLEGGDRFAAVILDLTIPGGMGGREVIGYLKELDPKVQAFVSSGYADDPIMSDYAHHGFVGIIAKPFYYDEMVKELAKIKEAVDNA
jgi:CheY-like chemotaxis protein